MKISDIYKLGVTQVQLDFVDININQDYPI